MPAVSSGHTGLNSQLCLFFFFFLAPAHSLQGLSPKGWTLGPLQWEGGVPTTRPPGNSLSYLLIKNPKMFCVSTFQILKRWFSSVQSVSRADFCNPMDCRTPGLPPVHPQLLEFTQTHDHWLSRWCHWTISSSVVHFLSHLQSFPAPGSFQTSQFFPWDGQSIGASASASVLPINIQDWFPLGSTCSISLLSKGLSRVFSNTTVQKHQFFAFFVVKGELFSNCPHILKGNVNCTFVLYCGQFKRQQKEADTVHTEME